MWIVNKLDWKCLFKPNLGLKHYFLLPKALKSVFLKQQKCMRYFAYPRVSRIIWMAPYEDEWIVLAERDLLSEISETTKHFKPRDKNSIVSPLSTLFMATKQVKFFRLSSHTVMCVTILVRKWRHGCYTPKMVLKHLSKVYRIQNI